MNKYVGAFTVAAAVGWGCGGTPGDGAVSSSDPIIGGAVDQGDASVVELRWTTADGYVHECTGSLIGPTTILTAGHCVSDPYLVYQYSTATGADWAAGGAGWTDVKSVTPDPRYSGLNATPIHNDIGIVTLAAPAGIKTLALGSPPGVGGAVRAVGFGKTSPNDSSTLGIRRTVTLTESSESSSEFTAGGGAAGTCHGDSGGPLLSNGVIVGVTSWGAPDCVSDVDHYMRVDDNLDFINQFLGGGGGGNPPPPPPPPGGGGGGGGGTIDCCASSGYYACTTPHGCTGGVDLGACISGCGSDFTCISSCQQKWSAGPDASCTRDPSQDLPKCGI